jgi:hypothetical protein
MSTNTTDVLVVGASPVGLVAAADLVRRDVAVRIIDNCLCRPPSPCDRGPCTQSGNAGPDGHRRRPGHRHQGLREPRALGV